MLEKPELDQDEISLLDIFNFLVDNWKLYVAGGLMGLLIAFGFVSLRGQYSAEAILVNQGAGLDFVTWRGLQKNLLSLAQEIAPEDKSSTDLQKGMTTGEWWKKSVLPTYSLTKAETKELIGISKDVQDSESTRILNFLIQVKGKSISGVEEDITYVINFLRNGAMFSAKSALVLDLERQVSRSAPRIDLDINSALQEIKIMNERRDRLYALRKEFPTENVVSQIVDVNESIAKFLPITTQLVAVLTDINSLDEKLLRLKQEKSKFEVLGEFVTRANIILKRGFQDQNLSANLINLEGEMRKNIPSNDLPKIIALDNIKNSLVGINTAYTLGLQQFSLPSVQQPKYLKPMGIGLIAGAFVCLLFSIIFKFWRIAMSRRREVLIQK
jgi:hypothetical protein